MDDAVVVGIDSLEGEPGFVAIEAAVQQLLQGREGEVAVIHGLVVDPHLPAHEGLALRGKGRGIGQDVLLVRIGGDHVASTDDVLVLVHELEVDDAVVVGKDGLEGQPGLILIEVLVVRLHKCIERIVGEIALIHGGIPKTHLPAHEGLALGGKAGGSRGLKFGAGGSGDDIAAAQGHILAVHIVHKGHMDGVVHSALTVQADHEGIRDNPLVAVVIQHNGHGGAVHTGVSLRIGAIRRHIGGGVKLDVVVITLDAQAVARHRVAASQQAGGNGLVALGGAVHLQVPQKCRQVGGGSPANPGSHDVVVSDGQIAHRGQFIVLGNVRNSGGVQVVFAGGYAQSVGISDLFLSDHVHKSDGHHSAFGGVAGQADGGFSKTVDPPVTVIVVIQHEILIVRHSGMERFPVSCPSIVIGGIFLSINSDNAVIALNPQTVALQRPGTVNQAGGQRLMALGVAVCLEHSKENRQLFLAGGSPANLNGGGAVDDKHVAIFGHYVSFWKL